MIVAFELERFVIDAHIFGIVISEIGYWQDPSQIVLFPIDEWIKIYLHCTILLLGAAIRLRMKCREELPLYAKKVA